MTGAFNSGVLVVCCLSANPPVITWMCVVRVPVGGRGSKRGFSGPAEDLRPVSEVECRGKIFGWPAVYGGRLQVHFPGGNQAQVPRQVRRGAVTPSLHPEVLDTSIHVTWTWVGHQAINGLHEGVSHRTIGGYGC